MKPSITMLAVLAAISLSVAQARAAEASAAKPTKHASLMAASEAAATDHSLVLLIFGAEWCGPCKALKKDTLASEKFHQSAGALRIAEVDIDADEKTTQAFAVSAVPALVLLTADQKIVARRMGYVDADGLLAWINEGRERVKRGQWEGTAPGAQIAELVTKASGDGLDPNDFPRLIAMLGQSDPAERGSVAKLLLAHRELAVPPLIEAVADPYLGVRIGAAELLQRLAPQAVNVDPWRTPDDLRTTVASLRKWWAEKPTLPAPTAPRAMDPTQAGSIKVAIEALRGNDPVRRTEAMSTLVGHGPAVLSPVREAIQRSEGKGDHRAVALLEDVRWAILIPDSVERRVNGTRNALARGTGAERQSATARLGRAGREAIPALSELVNDADKLVAENAVRALSSVGGKDAIPAMAGLLKAADSNLRMTAAQSLGKTKSTDAVPHLLTVLGDPNEVVACTALSAIDEVHSDGTSHSSRKSVAPEIVAALKKTFSDPRWRVRAAAAEVAGKLGANELAGDLRKLLDDTDGFVVKNTLVALHGMNASPEAGQLASLSQRLPGLRGDAVGMLIESGSDEAAKAVIEMFEQGTVNDQVAILTALVRGEGQGDRGANDPWKPLLGKALVAPEARVRRAAADALSLRPLKAAAELVGPLLGDTDAEVRGAAADVVLGIVAGKRRVASRMGYAAARFADEATLLDRNNSSKPGKTNRVYASADQLAAWHKELAKHGAVNPEVRATLALYATGDGRTDLPALIAALDKLGPRDIKRLAESPAGSVLVRKLPWPDGGSVLEKVCSEPSLFAMAVSESGKAAPEIAAYLLEPARFRSAVERASGEESGRLLASLLGGGGDHGEERGRWSLVTPGERTAAVVSALADSTNAAWRAAAVYALGKREAGKSTAMFEKALKDESPWVRAAGVQGLARASTERAALEERLGPMVADPHAHVAELAAMALLEPEVRQAAGLQWVFEYFTFEGTHVSSSSSIVIDSADDDRPLAVIESRPAFVASARGRLASADADAKPVFGLLLAQYGEFAGLESFAARLPESPSGRGYSFEERSLTDAVLTMVGLSRDAKYAPLLRGMMEKMKDEYELRKVLKAVRGMSGPEARQLRLEVNTRMRQQTRATDF